MNWPEAFFTSTRMMTVIRSARSARQRFFPVLAILLIATTVAPATLAGASSANIKPPESRLYVGSALPIGGKLTSTSGVYVMQLLSSGRVEILQHGHVAWTSTSSTGLKSIVTREANGAIKLFSPRMKARLVGGTAAPVPSYLTVTNNGEVALVSTAGVTVWQAGMRANVIGTPAAPYTRGALFGGTNPSVLCYTCQAANITGSAPPSDALNSTTNVDNMTGDFSTSNTLFDAPAVGGDLTLSLAYDTQLAESQVSTSATGLLFGDGWNSNFSSSITTGGPNVTINQASGAQVTFTQSADGGTSTSCQSSGDQSMYQYAGDYPFTSKYTIAGSNYNFCALDSVQGQLSEVSGSGYTYQQSGGQAIQNYGWTGQLLGTTTATASSGTPALGLVLYHASAGASSYGSVTFTSACPSTAANGCNIIYTNDGRDIVEVLNGIGEVSQVLDPAGHSYSMTYSSTTSFPSNLTSISEPSPTGSSTATWTYVYSTGASPYGSDLVEIYDPNAVSPSGLSSGASHSTTVTYGTSTFAGMVTSLTDGSASPVTTNYSYASACSTGQCAVQGSSQTTTITYPGECPNSTATCTAAALLTTAADIPQEIDQYSNGLETSTQLGSQTNANEVETWLYNWTLGDGVANTSEVITYPNKLILANSTPVTTTATIITDPAGNVVSTTDAVGDVATSAYNEATSLNTPELAWSFPGPSTNSSTSAPAGASQYTYNNFGQVITATDPLGNTSYYGYYSHYSLLCYKASAVLGKSLSWTSSTTPPSCTSTSTTLDAGAVSAPVGSTTYSYDIQGNIVAATVDAGDSGANSDPQMTQAAYDVMGNVLYSIPPAGQTGASSSSNAYATSTSYVTGTSLPSTRYQPDGITTSYSYDAAGNLKSTANTGVSSMWVYTTTVYDGDNRPCYQLQGYGNYGASCTASPQAGATITTYVPGSTTVASVTGGDWSTTSYYYNDLAYPNSPTQVQDAYGSQAQYSAYDDYGNACVMGDVAPTLGASQCTAPSGDTAATFDALGNQTSVTDPSGLTTTNSFENSSYPTLVTQTKNAQGAVTKYVYDADGNLVTTINPDNTGVTKNYDPNGRVCNKMATLVQYACGQGPGAAGVTQYSYNSADELVSMSDNTGNTMTPTIWSQATSYTYSAGQLVSTTDGNNKTLAYSYNNAGQVNCVGYPVSSTTSCGSPSSTTNTTVTKTYDPLGRLSSTTDWLGNTVSYAYGSYYNPNAVTKVTYPSATGVSASYGYDNAGNVSSLAASSTVASGTAISDTWSHNADEQVAVSSVNGATSPWQSYNANKQITHAANLATSTSSDVYTLAANGAITNDAALVGTSVAFAYSYNELCVSAPTAQACGATGTDTQYWYTLNGQRKSATPYASSVQGTSTNYNWNAYGQLCSTGTSSLPTQTLCGTAPANGTSYQYNGNGLRMSATTSSTTTASTWDNVSGGSVPLNINDATTTSGATTNTSYIYGDLLFGGTAPIEQITTSSSGTTVSYLVSNQTGVQGVYSGNSGSLGAVQEMAVYSVYGNQSLSAGTKVTPFGFQGSYTDPTGLIYLINRYYDPFTDQFLSIDPYVSMTDQPYVFTNDNPLNAEDPNGLIPGPQYGARWPKGNLQGEIARYLGPDVGVAKGLKSSKIVFYDVNDPKKEVVYDTKRNYYRISNSSKGRTEYYDRANDTWATNGNLGDQGQANSHYSNTGDSYTSVSDAAQKYGGSSTGDSGGGDEGGGMDGAGFLFGVFPGACGPGGLAMMSKSICNNFQGPGPHKNT